MFSKQHRLAKSKEISRVYARGRSFFSPFFSAKVFYESGKVKFAVVVSTKVSKKSTLRNRLRRLVREYLRLHMEQFREGSYVITLKSPVAKLSGEEVHKAFGVFAEKYLIKKQ